MAPQPLIESKSGSRVKSPFTGDTALNSQIHNSGSSASRRAGGSSERFDGGIHRVGQRGDQHVGLNQVDGTGYGIRGRRNAVNTPTTAGMGQGMGMGYGSGYGMMPMAGMGYGYGMGYGGMGAMGPMGMIYSINYFIATVGQFASMLGMGTQAVGHLLHVARENLLKLEKTVRQSELRRWMQRKSEKSPLFRWALIIVSMLAASQLVRLARYLIEVQMRRTGGALLGGPANAPNSSGVPNITQAAAASVDASGSLI
jgi:hypothetical protein